MSDTREVLSALIDRESVDPDVLAELLEDPENRRLLVDVVRVRAMVNADEISESASYSAFRSGLHVPGGPHGSRWLRAAAVFLLLVGGAGGGAWLERYVSREAPPKPDRVVKFQPGVDWTQLGGRP